MPRQKKTTDVEIIPVTYEYVYVYTNETPYRYKIGKTRNPEQRTRDLQTGSDEKLHLLYVKEVQDMDRAERILHDIFARWRILNEWFHIEDREGQRLLKQIFEGIDVTTEDNARLTRMGFRYKPTMVYRKGKL